MVLAFPSLSPSAEEVFRLAQEEARLLNHDYIGMEHILLGLVRETGCMAAGFLASLSVDLSKVRSAVEFLAGRGEREPSPGKISLNRGARRMLESAVNEAYRLKHRHTGTTHLLFGILREGEGVATEVLVGLADNLKNVEQKLQSLLH